LPFKVIVRKKEELYSRKVKGQEQEGDRERLAEVASEVNRTRKRLRKAYFSQRLEERVGDARATWEVLGEVLGRRKTKGGKVGCGFFRKDGVGLTGKVEVAVGFCEFYWQVGPKLAAKIKREREREEAFLEYMGDRVRESLFWRPTTPQEVEGLCGSLDPHKGMGWDEVSTRVIKTVAHEISGPLSRLFNCCMRGVTIQLTLRWHGWYRSLRVKTRRRSKFTGRSLCSLFFRGYLKWSCREGCSSSWIIRG
jgi:hypothetical protein